MLKMYAKLLIEMLTNREDYQEFDNLDIDPEIKCILYECYHAKDRTDVREQDRYETEISRFIQREQEKTFKLEKLNKEREEFIVKAEKEKSIKREEQEAKEKEELKQQRSIKRKPGMPKANRRNFEEENLRMGVQNELDLLIGEDANKQDLARTKKDKGLIDYT